MIINLQNLCGTSTLAGALAGRAALARLLGETTSEPGSPEPVFLDFSGIEVATASFLRESVLAFRDIVRRRPSKFYPVLANVSSLVREELIEVLRPRGDVLMSCSIQDDGAVQDVELLGELDPKQRLTFDLVQQHGETDAGELMRRYGEGERLKHSTAWNNRLTGLAARGLVVEQSYGRAKRYRPLFAAV